VVLIDGLIGVRSSARPRFAPKFTFCHIGLTGALIYIKPRRFYFFFSFSARLPPCAASQPCRAAASTASPSATTAPSCAATALSYAAAAAVSSVRRALTLTAAPTLPRRRTFSCCHRRFVQLAPSCRTLAEWCQSRIVPEKGSIPSADSSIS
jgi:hypothetical protein